MKVKIKHVDGITDVIAKVWVRPDEVSLDYRFEGMSYSQSLSIKQAVDLKIIECPHDAIQPILGFENSIEGEECLTCGKKI